METSLIEPWMLRLKAACEAGYYRTEADVDRQEHFPWQNKHCGDCPFWSNEVCRVYAERRAAVAPTCATFDRATDMPARQDLDERVSALLRAWQEATGR